MQTFFKSALSLLLALGAAGPGFAQTFPSRPVRIVIGFPPGGGIDSVARLMVPKLADAFKQPVVVENRPGANGVVAMEAVAKSPPDGHTVFLGTSGNLSMNPVFYSNLPFSMERDFMPLTQVASLPFLIVTNPALPVKTLADLIAHAKSNPGKVNYSSSGNGSTPHLAGELFNSMAGIKTVHVPYKGSSPSISDLIGGQVQYTFDAIAITMPHVKAGKLRAIAITSPKRVAYLPDLPAAAETVPGYEVVNWYGMVIPAATPRDVVTRLHGETLRVLGDPDIRQKINALGIDPVGSHPEEFGAFMKAETIKWARVIKQAKIALE